MKILRVMIFVYPTETCYGLGCSAFNRKEIMKIYRLKKRPLSKPMIVLVDSIIMWKTICDVSSEALVFARKYWPGPVTIIQPKKKCIPDILTERDLGVRISSHPAPNRIIKNLRVPIVSTSANISGGKNPYSIKDIPKSILDSVGQVFDEGELPYSPPSTVIRIESNKIKVLRKGRIIL